MEAFTNKIRGTSASTLWKWGSILTFWCQCYDAKNMLVAVWELAQRSEPFYARLTLKHAALPVVTELLTTFTLNRIVEALNW